jgi:glycosyltransferase involved in cell wall biosynthesis
MAKRLLLVISHFSPDRRAGGAEMFALAEAAGLAVDHGWEVTVVTTAPREPVTREVALDRVQVRRIPYQFRLSNSPVSLRWRRELKKIVAEVDPDLVNVHLPVPGLADIASGAAGGRPVVAYYHYGSMRKGNLLLDPVIRLYESLVLPLCLRKARRLACGSTYVRDGILRNYVGKTRIIPPGVDTTRFSPAPRRNTAPVVLYVGSLNLSDKHKRFMDLLAACREMLPEMPGLRLLVAGGGDGLPVYKEMAAEMGLGGCVEFLGRIHGDALADVYRQAAVLALPSLAEAFGMVLIEAMASGLPVVAAQGGAAPEVVADGVDGILVPSRDPHALADALRTVLADPDRATAMGAAGRRKVVGEMQWPQRIAALNDLFTDVLAAAAPAPLVPAER